MAEVLAPRCSDCKKSGIVQCDGCHNRFCATHFTEHRQELDTQFEQLRNERETLSRQVENHSSIINQSQRLILLQKINHWEQQTLKNIQQTADRARHRINELIKSKDNNIKVKFDQISKEFRQRKIEKNYFEQDLQHLKKKLTQIQDDLNSYQSDLEMILPSNESNAKLGIDFDHDIHNRNEYFVNGTLLSLNSQLQLNEFFGKQDQMWELIYKATRDGFSSVDFHRCCDRKGSTLTVIQSSNGYLFGGFTSTDWKSYDDCKCFMDTNAFLFTLINPNNISPTKYSINMRGKDAIACKTNMGPSFGQWDICIHSNSDQNSRSYIDFPSDYIDSTGKGRFTFTGSHFFKTIEIEVYRLKHNSQ